MKIDKKLIKELVDNLKEFELTELEYQDGQTKIKVSKVTRGIEQSKTGAVVSPNKTVLNTQDCSFIDFKINYLGNENIYGNKMSAEHFKLTGTEFTGDDVDIDIWYKDFQWVKMIFYKDGSEIEYFLKDFDNNG